MESKICKYCNQSFHDIKGVVFSNHVRWCDKNPNRNNTKNIQRAVNNTYDKKYGKYQQFKVFCFTCNQAFYIKERKNQFPKKKKYFCCVSCKNTRVLNEEVKDRISKSLRKRTEIKCKKCNKNFYPLTNKTKFCSRKCYSLYRIDENQKRNISTYRNLCKFNFNIFDYPDEFDVNLIRKYGFYSPSNKANNLNGVSKDHKISISWAYKNNINPKIISHPANCKLLKHTDNISKHKNCSITFIELLENIIKWDEKYGEREC